MNTLPSIQYIKNSDGEPEYAIVPFKVFQELTQTAASQSIPHTVVGKIVLEKQSPVRAWREHLGFTQAQLADSMGISQSAFSQMENAKRISKRSRIRIAIALSIDPQLLDI